MFTSACSTPTSSQIVTKSELIFIEPPLAYVMPCKAPFDKPPLTHSERETAVRDVTWKSAFDLCALKLEQINAWYESKRAEKH
jgi:hypothetical protein